MRKSVFLVAALIAAPALAHGAGYMPGASADVVLALVAAATVMLAAGAMAWLLAR